MSSRRQRNIPLGGRYKQVSLYHISVVSGQNPWHYLGLYYPLLVTLHDNQKDLCTIFPVRALDLVLWNRCWNLAIILYRMHTFKLPWIFPGAPLRINGAPGNIQGNLTGVRVILFSLVLSQFRFTGLCQHLFVHSIGKEIILGAKRLPLIWGKTRNVFRHGLAGWYIITILWLLSYCKHWINVEEWQGFAGTFCEKLYW